MLAISCFAAGIEPNIPVTRFGNACSLFLEAGMPYLDIQQTRSGRLSEYFDIRHERLHDHDALDDALSVAYSISKMLNDGKLNKGSFDTRKHSPANVAKLFGSLSSVEYARLL